MKVLQINSVCGVGSTGRIVTDIHAILKRQGHESIVAFGRGEAINCDNTLRIGKKIDNYTHVIKTRIFDKHGFGSKRATKNFIRIVKELNPDIIHLHNIHGYYINVEMLFDYLKEANKPVVWTLHDCWGFTGHCAYFDFSGCNCWKLNGEHKCIQKTSYPASIFLNNSIENFMRKRKAFTGVKNLNIVTPSKWLASLVKQSFLNEYNINIINNGIDLEVFKPTNSNFREKYGLENKFMILGVANIWDQRKGLKYFIELSSKLKDDEVILLVGLTAKQIKKLPNNIIGISRTNNIKELAELYSESNVFVNLTLEDNYPTTNLEAIACGTPVITFDTGGSGESVDSQTGFVIEKGNIEQLIQKIRYIKDIGKSNYVDRCTKKAIANFGSDKTFESYLDLYKQLL
ncbi:glycosyltransferase [Caldifermentibacillus hisashii]|uniref:glycosyltransferase n=1 Tax=Caldifermentibacillus hisashii TaxID=996558 RepID=UPI002E1B0316|nr:glycosyltransferase [Caldifermentibacillus hisashii]